MALSNEDKKDVKKHLGKALANKVSKVTRDKKHPTAYSINGREVDKARFELWHQQKAIADRNKANNYMGGNHIKNGKKVWDSISKTGKYESPAAKKALAASAEKYKAYEAERKERYKRDGISE